MDDLIGSQNGFGTAIGQGDSQDAIAVIIINHKDVVVARDGLYREFAGEVHVGLPGGFQY